MSGTRKVGTRRAGSADDEDFGASETGSESESSGVSVEEWLDGGQAVLDEEGRIATMNASLEAWLGMEAAKGGAASFWAVLRAQCPGWGERLDRIERGVEPYAAEDFVSGTREDGRMWYRLEVARHRGMCHVRLGSILPPSAELSEAGWGRHVEGPTAMREMYLRLLRAEAQLGKLSEHWPGVIFSQRPDFSFDYVTGRIEELTGLTLEEWRHQPRRFWDVVHEADAVELQHQFAQAARTGQAMTTTFRVRNVRTGRGSYVLEHRRPTVSRGRLVLGYEGVWLDVTRQTLAEKRLTSAAWKETLAVVTMGLAHDFSNVMAGIHSLSESFHQELDATHPFWEGMGLIKKSALQASQLVHRIVNLHLGKPGERNYHDLNQIVGELLELVRKVIPRRIEIATELSKESLPVYVDAFEFRQVIINLALNASDAMPERGRLVFRTSAIAEPMPAARLRGAAVRYPCAVLSVQDNGCGIRPAHLDLIFDPFFTTKSGSKGSGLGLYNACLFAEKHQGGIAVESEENRGSVFHVCLPVADFSEAERDREREAAGSGKRLGILLCGTPGVLMDAEAEMLRTDGYQVATADCPNRVLEILGAKEYDYEGVLLLVDSGNLPMELHLAAWRRARPGLKVILRPVGRDGDELDVGMVKLADRVLTPELSQADMLAKLRRTLTPDIHG
ncbi:MAG: PAS domain-containing protein, partial [Verrucomicrobiales bacterium]|nr:PAS domain-containing protein [Verrucomicrobiales bacterium]